MKNILLIIIIFILLDPFTAFGWQRHSIGSIFQPIYIIVDDLDQDGDPDVAAGSGISPNPLDSEVAWFENDLANSGTFIKGIISPASPTSQAIQNAEGLVSADVDQDGRKDIGVTAGRIVNQFGGFYWFKSPPLFQGSWMRYSIVEPITGNSFFKVNTIDANEDTWPDFVAGGDAGAYIFLNPTNPTDPFATWDQLLLDPYSGPSVSLADVDNDGRADILNTNTGVVPPETLGNVSWFKIINDAGDVSVLRTVIDAALESAFDIAAMDITGDGYPEVFVSIFNPPPGDARLNGIFWYKNPGSGGGAWIKHVVDPDYSGSDIYIGDINGDGQDDLVASGLFSDKIAWFEYEWLGGTAVWTTHMVDVNVDAPGDIVAYDFDGDEDMDIVVAALNDNEMAWYENDGVYQVCGDGIPEPPEECDDGNTDDSDGCSNCAVCAVSEISSESWGCGGTWDPSGCCSKKCGIYSSMVFHSTFCIDDPSAIEPGACDWGGGWFVYNGFSDGTDICCNGTKQNVADCDNDGVPDSNDNCPVTPNGPMLGTCTHTANFAGNQCTHDTECSLCVAAGICSMGQEDADADGIGDACDQ